MCASRASPGLWVVLALGAGVLPVLASGCNRVDHAASGDTAAPRLELDAPRVSLEGMVEGQTRKVQVPFRNAGQGTLEIESVERSRFCSAQPSPPILAGGQQGQLHLECLADLHGPIEERVTLHSNDPRRPAFELVIEGTVQPRLAFAPRSVTLSLDFGQNKSQKVLIQGANQAQARIELQRGAWPGVSRVEPLLTEAGAVRGYRITCTGEQVGLHASSLLVATHLPDPKQITLSYSCRVKGTLDISPSNPYFDLNEPGIKQQLIRVRSRQPGFVVHQVEVLDGPFAATLLPRAAEGSFPVRVRVLEDRIPTEAHRATGTLLIVSNDATQPRRQVRLVGFGRAHRGP